MGATFDGDGESKLSVGGKTSGSNFLATSTEAACNGDSNLKYWPSRSVDAATS